MNIKNISSAINAYKINDLNSKKAESVSKTSSHKNVDKVEFSSSKAILEGLKSNAKDAVDKNADAEKINSLKAQINSNQYNISSENIADAILGTLFA